MDVPKPLGSRKSAISEELLVAPLANGTKTRKAQLPIGSRGMSPRTRGQFAGGDKTCAVTRMHCRSKEGSEVKNYHTR